MKTIVITSALLVSSISFANAGHNVAPVQINKHGIATQISLEENKNPQSPREFSALPSLIPVSIADTNKDISENTKGKVSTINDRITSLSYPSQEDKMKTEFRNLWLCKGSNYLQNEACEYTYKKGDTGPAGGIVYYTTDGGKHGLEVGLEDLVSSPWGCFGIAITGARGQEIGDGKANTDAILAADCTIDGVKSAAHVAASYSSNGISGWHLPSISSLKEIYYVVYRSSLPGFHRSGTPRFWSSTENNAERAWLMIFGPTYVSDYPDYKNVITAAKVRPVRPF